MADIFKEVEEDLRRDQAARLWQRYGRFAIAAAVLLVLSVAGFKAWEYWDNEQRMERSTRFAAALSRLAEGEDAQARQEFSTLAEAGGGYGVLAAFNEARLNVESGDVEAAIAIWDRLAGNGETDAAFRGAAVLLSVLHQADRGDPAVLEARLEPLTAADSGYRPLALELTAAMALRQGDRARARELYTRVADDLEAPPGMRARAAQMLSALEE